MLPPATPSPAALSSKNKRIVSSEVSRKVLTAARAQVLADAAGRGPSAVFKGPIPALLRSHPALFPTPLAILGAGGASSAQAAPQRDTKRQCGQIQALSRYLVRRNPPESLRYFLPLGRWIMPFRVIHEVPLKSALWWAPGTQPPARIVGLNRFLQRERDHY